MVATTTGVELALLELDAELDSPDRVEAWLHDPARTAHRLVSVPTAALVEEALGGQPATVPAGRVLPGGLWPVLPDRLLALHPGRRAERLERLRIPVTRHLELTAVVLEQWGWAQPGRRKRAATGARCPFGAQHVLFRLGYGTEVTVMEAGRRIQGVLASRGVTEPYWAWNDRGHVTRDQVIGVVRQAAREAS